MPLNDANGVVSAIETTVASAVIAWVVWVIVVSGLTFVTLTLLTPEWCAWLYWVTSNLFPEYNVPFWVESTLTNTLVATVLVLLPAP